MLLLHSDTIGASDNLVWEAYFSNVNRTRTCSLGFCLRATSSTRWMIVAKRDFDELIFFNVCVCVYVRRISATSHGFCWNKKVA